MAVYPGARYRPLNRFSYPDAMSQYLGIVLHVNDSNGASLYGWIAGDNGMSCHWQVAKSGQVEQYIDTRNASWCQTAGNRTYLSIETEGHPDEALTDEQVNAIAGIYAWAHKQHGIPFQLANYVGSRGFAWYGMGGNAWGGHPGCPGELRKAQRAHILELAQAGSNPADPWEEIMAFYSSKADFEKAVYDQMRDALHDSCEPKNALWRLGERIRSPFLDGPASKGGKVRAVSTLLAQASKKGLFK